ncbi:hypothetical protein PG993_005838 [Apiospora rasikravindrae]|uniref:Clr5 domain-containing protein n=1 Tax=Apiospora rasikravindrae TaxID=990691 RepID=A0ABR1T9X3_9PEZI
MTYPPPPPPHAETTIIDHLPGGLTDASNRKGNRGSPASLQTYKEAIRQLYLVEDMRLDDVIRVLSAKGVQATRRMYKTQLGKWKFFKNNRKSDVAAILKNQRQRAAAGKQTAFIRHGKRIDVARYLERSGSTVDDLLGRTGTVVPEHVRCVTPPPGSSLLRSPGDLGFKENVGHWFTLEGDKYKVLNHDEESMYESFRRSPSFRVITTYSDAVWLLSRHYVAEGMARARVAFDQFPTILHEWPHYAIFQLLALSMFQPITSIHQSLWRYLAEYCAIRLGKRHITYLAINEIARIFNAGDEEHRTELLGDCLTSITDTYKGSDGYYDVLKLWRQDPGLVTRRHIGYHVHLETWDPDHTHSTELVVPGDVSDKERFQAALLLDRCRTGNWECPAAYNRSVVLVTLGSAGDTTSITPYTKWHCLYQMARYHRSQCEKVPEGDATGYEYHHELARRYLWCAIDLDVKLWSPTKDYYESLVLLQEWCQEAGQAALANDMEKWKTKCVKDLLEK